MITCETCGGRNGHYPTCVPQQPPRRLIVCVAWGREECGYDDMIRASGDVVCDCGREYRDHPHCQNSWVDSTEHYHLRVLCSGRHVHL